MGISVKRHQLLNFFILAFANGLVKEKSLLFRFTDESGFLKIPFLCRLAKNGPVYNMDETNLFSNMQLDGGPQLTDMATEAKVLNF